MALKGTLGNKTLVDIFNTLHTWTMSGLIVLITPNHRGVIYISRGKPIDSVIICATDHAIVAQGEHALRILTTWNGAAYHFLENPAVCNRPVRVPYAEAYMANGTQRCDSSHPMTSATLTLDTHIQLSLTGLSAQENQPLEMRHWRIIGALAEARALRELSACTGIAMPEVVRAVGELLRQGLVEFAPEESREVAHETIQRHMPLHERTTGEPHSAFGERDVHERAVSQPGRLNIAHRIPK
jgi:hypothetical protein